MYQYLDEFLAVQASVVLCYKDTGGHHETGTTNPAIAEAACAGQERTHWWHRYPPGPIGPFQRSHATVQLPCGGRGAVHVCSYKAQRARYRLSESILKPV